MSRIGRIVVLTVAMAVYVSIFSTGCRVPGTQPPPSPSPTVSASPTPPVVSCPLEPNPARMRIKLSGVRHSVDGPFLDATFQYRYHTELTPSLGPCGRVWCDLGVESPFPQCDAVLVGTPTWDVTMGRGEPGVNPYFLMLKSDQGTAVVCSGEMPDVCAAAGWILQGNVAGVFQEIVE